MTPPPHRPQFCRSSTLLFFLSFLLLLTERLVESSRLDVARNNEEEGAASSFLMVSGGHSVVEFRGKSMVAATPDCPPSIGEEAGGGSDCTKPIQTLLDDTNVSHIHFPAGNSSRSKFSGQSTTTSERTYYIVEPLFLNRSNLVITCDPGAVLLAKRGEYHSLHAVLFTIAPASITSNFTMLGCTLKMWRSDYADRSKYEHSEWRHAMLLSARNVLIEDVIVEESGGDGFYVTGDGDSCPTDVILNRIHSRNNFRQGISIICAKNFSVRDSTFEGTKGTNPQCGIDVEPNVPSQQVTNLSFDNVLLRNNSGCQLAVSPHALSNFSQTMTMEFKNIVGVDTTGYGLIYSVPWDHSVESKSQILFNNFTISDSAKFGLFFMHGNLSSSQTIFNQTTLSNVSYGDHDSIASIAMYVDLCRNISLGGVGTSGASGDEDRERRGSSGGADGGLRGTSSFITPLQVHQPNNRLLVYLQESKIPHPLATGIHGVLNVTATYPRGCISSNFRDKRDVDLECLCHHDN